MSSCTAVMLAISMVAGQAKPGATEGVPPKVLKQFDGLVGDWEIEFASSDGMSGKSSLTCSWAPGKHMLMWHSEWDVNGTTVRGSGIFGWDALEEQVHMSEFWENGGYHHRHFKLESEKLWVGHEFSGASLDGKPMRQKISLERVGPSKFIMKTWDVVVDGQEKEGSATFTFTRKQK
jgi:hypothetical protein